MKSIHSWHVEYIHNSKARATEIALLGQNLIQDVKLSVELFNTSLGRNLIRRYAKSPVSVKKDSLALTCIQALTG
jgi:hypothetical protein